MHAVGVQARIALALGVTASALSIVAVITGSSALTLAGAVVHALFYFWAASSMLGYMLADSDVTKDELWAVGATFTLVAWAFAYVFAALQQVVPGSFTAAVDPDAPRTWLELLFLSFTNLSSTGLSDVVPILPKARAVVMIEQLAGLVEQLAARHRQVAPALAGVEGDLAQDPREAAQRDDVEPGLRMGHAPPPSSAHALAPAAPPDYHPTQMHLLQMHFGGRSRGTPGREGLSWTSRTRSCRSR